MSNLPHLVGSALPLRGFTGCTAHVRAGGWAAYTRVVDTPRHKWDTANTTAPIHSSAESRTRARNHVAARGSERSVLVEPSASQVLHTSAIRTITY